MTVKLNYILDAQNNETRKYDEFYCRNVTLCTMRSVKPSMRSTARLQRNVFIFIKLCVLSMAMNRGANR